MGRERHFVKPTLLPLDRKAVKWITMAIRSFGDAGTADIAAQQNTKAARAKLPVRMHRIALEKMVLLDAAAAFADLAVWRSLRLEKLKGSRRRQHSIRINKQFRICFVWRSDGAYDVEIVDYH
jgi:proteic killer suppression protein